MDLFDVGILETTDHIDPMSRIIYHRTSTWLTHCVLFKGPNGDIWDPRPGGILDGNVVDYAGRRVTIVRFKGEYNKIEALSWARDTQKNCKGYDFKALWGFLTGNQSWEDADYWYCSEFPYWQRQRLGPVLTRVDKTFIYPEFFNSSNSYKLIDEFTISGNPAEKPIEFNFDQLVVGAP